MQISTKYNVGDKVWIFYPSGKNGKNESSNDIKSGIVTAIHINVRKNENCSVVYEIELLPEYNIHVLSTIRDEENMYSNIAEILIKAAYGSKEVQEAYETLGKALGLV